MEQHSNPMHTVAGVWSDCQLETNQLFWRQTFGRFWETTFHSEQFQCSRWHKEISSVHCHPMSFVDFVVLPPGHGRSVTDFWVWDAHEVQLRCPDGVSGDRGGCSARSGLKPKFYWSTQTMVTVGIFPFKENSHVRAGKRTRDLVISSQRLWPLDHEASLVGLISTSLSGVCPDCLESVQTVVLCWFWFQCSRDLRPPGHRFRLFY